MLTGPQIRAARSLVGMLQTELAESAGVSAQTIKAIEAQRGPVSANTRTVSGIQKALEAAGVVFIPANGGGPGVRMK